jgi:CubicO group peptidase (beta-lactamase class C family)
MRARSYVLILMVLCAFCIPAASDSVERDYWPTNEWRSSEPEQQGMDSAVLDQLTMYVEEKLPLTSSVLAIRHGYLVYEEYKYGGQAAPRVIYSATKGILSALVGIAIQEGYIKSLDQKIMDFFPEYANQDINPEVNKITIRNLLTMSDGLSSFDMDSNFSNRTLSRTLRHEPGKDFFYNCMSPQVLSVIISKSTGMKALDFGMEYLFEPLGISQIAWQETSGFSMGCYGIQLTPRDMAKIGYLFLNMGLWEGKQLVPRDWVTESTRTQITVPRTQDYISITGKYYLDQYGYYWWIRPRDEHAAYIAWGYGGQFIYVIPDLDCVVIITTIDSDKRENMNAHIYLSIIDDYIVASIR